MLILNEHLGEECRLGLWEISESEEELLELLEQNQEIQRTVTSFLSQKRRLEFLAVRVLLRVLVGGDKSIVYHANGAPYLQDNSYNISITHTGKYVAVILHSIHKVGIDIERISDRPLRVMHKFLSQNEIDFVVDHSEKTHFTLMWAAKEVLYKILGEREVSFTQQLHLEPFQSYLEGVIDANESRTPYKKGYQLLYRVYPDFVLVWTVDKN